jgi:hypothetical protein
MPVQLIGGSVGDAPFNRTFFNVTLGDLVEPAKGQAQKLTLYLVDGTTLDVCRIEEMTDTYLALRVYQGSTDTCETTLHLIPYATIYRLEISQHAPDRAGTRVGFSWSNPKRPSPKR